jgi:hypothetical protein
LSNLTKTVLGRTEQVETLVETVGNRFTGFTQKEINRLFSVLGLLDVIRGSSSGSLSAISKQTLAEASQAQLATTGITSTQAKLRSILRDLLESNLLSDQEIETPISKKYAEIIKIICLEFVLNEDTIFYVTQFVARNLATLITYELSVLASLSDIIDNLYAYTEYKYDRGEELFGLTEDILNQADFMALKTSEAQKQIQKVTDAVLEGTINPTSVGEFQKIVNDITELEPLDQYVAHNDPFSSIKKFSTRVLYLQELHEKIYTIYTQWSLIISEYVALDLPAKFAQSILNAINQKLEFWREHFQSVDDQAKFTELQEYLEFLICADTTVASTFDYDPTGTIESTGQTEWVDDGDNDTVSPYLRADGVIKQGDRISLDAPTLDSDGLAVPYHTVTGVSAGYVWVTPEIEEPIEGTSVKYVIVASDDTGAEYFGKYSVLVERFKDLLLPRTLELAPVTPSQVYSPTRKAMGSFLWSFVQYRNQVVTTHILRDIEDRKTRLESEITTLSQILTVLQTYLVSYILPQQTRIDEIDDILDNHGLDILREAFVQGKIERFFRMPVDDASSGLSLVRDISLMMRELKVEDLEQPEISDSQNLLLVEQ